MDDRLDLHIEALIFAAEHALTIKEIQQAIHSTFDIKIQKNQVEEEIQKIMDKYNSPEFAIQVVEIAYGFHFMTKSQYHKIIGDFLKLSQKKRLTKAALETLSIIAYKQPITKAEVESIRGVNCDYSIQKLLEKELVEITGRKEGPGRPLIYGTTAKFLNHFGLKSHKDLPQVHEIKQELESIGEAEEMTDHGE